MLLLTYKFTFLDDKLKQQEFTTMSNNMACAMENFYSFMRENNIESYEILKVERIY